MAAFARFRSLARNLVFRTRVDRDLDDEIAHAVETLSREHMAAGRSPREARRAALRELGSTDLVKEQIRSIRTGWYIRGTLADARFGLRLLRRDGVYAAASLVTLALGIGATTAVFSVVSGLVLRPLPFEGPDRLVQIRGSSPSSPRGDAVWNLPRYRDASASFAAIAAYEVSAAYLRAGDGVVRVMGVRVEPRFFDVLGVAPLRGRVFTASDQPDVAVIGESFWRRQFGASPDAIGRTLVLDGRLVTVVGVMPSSFQFPYGAAGLLSGWQPEARTDVWRLFDQPLGPRSRVREVTGRLRSGVSIAAAQAELAGIARQLAAEFPDTNAGRGVHLEPLAVAVVAPPIRRVLFMLFGAVALLMALAAGNVVTLSIVRAARRGREMAVRTALGASRGRLVRQFLTESLCLALAGGAAGFVVAWWSLRTILRLVAAEIPRASDVTMDWRVFLFLLGTSVLAGVVSGVAPAWFAAGRPVQPALQAGGGQSTMNTSRRRLQSGLVVAEVALASVLAVGAALLVRELVRLRTTDLGMSTANVVTFHLGQPRPSIASGSYFHGIADRISELPGVTAAGFTQLLPLQNWGWTSSSSDFFVKGRPAPSPTFPIHLRYVTPGYFDALSISIDRGRPFTNRDGADAPPVVLVNDTLARRYFLNEDPVGRDTNRGTIVGVVRDFHQVNADQPPFPELYFPIAQNWSQVNDLGMTLVVRTSARPDLAIGPVRRALGALSPQSAIFDVKTMDEVVTDSLAAFTLYLWMMALFAGLAVALALSGTYGVVAYTATARTREFAIRVALGADRRHVARLVIGHGLTLAIAGLAAGTLAALALSPLLAELPVTVRPPDAVTITPIAVAVTAVALAACLVPARRATRIDPTAALRNE